MNMYVLVGGGDIEWEGLSVQIEMKIMQTNSFYNIIQSPYPNIQIHRTWLKVHFTSGMEATRHMKSYETRLRNFCFCENGMPKIRRGLWPQGV